VVAERSADVSSQAADAAPVVPSQRLYAVLVNGGGERESNYRSHLTHLQKMLQLLARAGVPPDHIAVFASDGEDPAPDLAQRALVPAGDVELLLGTHLEGSLARPIEYVSTEIPGVRIEPASKQALGAWFAGPGKRLRAGDTLLFYVTDHGSKDPQDPSKNRIVLWGRKEGLSVRDLDALLATLDPGIRVVTLLSQCFSGGFAHLAEVRGPDGLPSGRACGFFSSTEDRRAYGCYPEVRGNEEVGHSVKFIEALAVTGDFPASQRLVLIDDDTPDVPLRTSDLELEWLLEGAARGKAEPLPTFADGLLREAWRDPKRFEREIRLLDGIGLRVGMASPRSVSEVERRLTELPQVSEPLKQHADAWRTSLSDLTEANLNRFLQAHPAWVPRVSREATQGLTAEQARALGSGLAAELGPFTRADTKTMRRLETLADRAEKASEASYRMEVREAALRRMRAVLLAVAGRVYLEQRASDAQRTAFAALADCERLGLDVPGRDPTASAADTAPALPSFDDDVRTAAQVAPAWMGINFTPASEDRGADRGVGPGAVVVRHVFEGSPAEAAGIVAGDVILGPPGKPFAEPRQVREWTMLQTVGEPAPLEVLHGGERLTRTLVPGAHPGKLPELPSPPKAGQPAPPLQVEAYRGAVPASLADGKPHLLFFWATWCLPCKASLPEVMAYAHERGTDVVAITDEERPQLDAFFSHFDRAFPRNVALDPGRDTFLRYGVSGTPTFVLVDGTGAVRSVSTGYSAAKGLGIADWTWAARR
jgi:thiol-disulfide isomerase/thioredoxin